MEPKIEIERFPVEGGGERAVNVRKEITYDFTVVVIDLFVVIQVCKFDGTRLFTYSLTRNAGLADKDLLPCSHKVHRRYLLLGESRHSGHSDS